MGVYIKGMKMPKSCASCDVACLHYLDRGLDGLLAKICRIESRLPNCPLVPVPEHGDLIDRDALRQSMYHEAFETDSPIQKWDSGCWIRYKMFENNIKDTPTIIPAEESET